MVCSAARKKGPFVAWTWPYRNTIHASRQREASLKLKVPLLAMASPDQERRVTPGNSATGVTTASVVCQYRVVSRKTQSLLEAFERLPVEEKRIFAEEALRRLAREEMDRADIEDARAALAEPGESISLEQLKKELGLPSC